MKKPSIVLLALADLLHKSLKPFARSLFFVDRSGHLKGVGLRALARHFVHAVLSLMYAIENVQYHRSMYANAFRIQEDVIHDSYRRHRLPILV